MKKKIYIILGVVLVAVIGFAAYSAFFNRRVSPTQVTEFKHDGLEMKVTYCRPSKKGRTIFGEAGSNALLPYGQYWRLGANESTEISFNKDITFAGSPVSAGVYRMYAVPDKESWEITLNSQLGTWGSDMPDNAMDVVTVNVPVKEAPTDTEQFTINFGSDDSDATMDFIWDNVLVSVPIAIQ